jgi:hypothetical protein
MTPIAIVLFACGVISLIVGVARLYPAARAATRLEHADSTGSHTRLDPRIPSWQDPRSLVRRSLPAVSWLVVAVYGLVLASVGIVLGR